MTETEIYDSNGKKLTREEYLNASAPPATTKPPDAKKVSSATQEMGLPTKQQIRKIIQRILDPLNKRHK